MDISGIIQSYDSRVASSAAMSRPVMAPHYGHNQPYTGTTSNGLVASHQQIQQNPFSYNQAYALAAPNGLIPMNYIQQRPLPRLMQTQPVTDGSRATSYTGNDRQGGYVEEHHSRSPTIKQESHWNPPIRSSNYTSPKAKTITSPLPNGTSDVNFGTEVDVLMKAIQAKSQAIPPQTNPIAPQSRPVVGTRSSPPYTQPFSQGGIHTEEASRFKLTDGDPQDEPSSPKSSKKRYQCTIEGCSRSFYQKTHLDIHIRAHTGDKPYNCKFAGCGRNFSQLGNLKTHERRHTGDRPFVCDICGKKFAQRGNVRAHRIVHEQAKPYECRLDDCAKLFTQLGNLKSHQNKFHIDTIRKLTSKFASIKDGDLVNAADKELWEYFANLYKNSNKGIKGRGKENKVANHSMSMSSNVRSMGVHGSGYTMNGAGRGNMVVGVMGTGMRQSQSGRGDRQYEMFDADDESQAGSHSVGGSSVGTCYDDAPSDGYEENERAGQLAFGDRIY